MKKFLTFAIILCMLCGFAVIPVQADAAVWDGSVASGFESGGGNNTAK